MARDLGGEDMLARTAPGIVHFWMNYCTAGHSPRLATHGDLSQRPADLDRARDAEAEALRLRHMAAARAEASRSRNVQPTAAFVGLCATGEPAKALLDRLPVVTGLLVDLRERGLDVTGPMLVGLDGSKALRRAVLDVLDHPVIQRCQLTRSET